MQPAAAVVRGEQHPQQPALAQRVDRLVAEAPIDLGLLGIGAHDVGDRRNPLEVIHSAGRLDPLRHGRRLRRRYPTQAGTRGRSATISSVSATTSRRHCVPA